MIYEIYMKDGIPTAVEFNGDLEGLVELVGRSEFLWGRSRQTGKREVVFVRRGESVAHINECGEEWSDVMIVEDLEVKP